MLLSIVKGKQTSVNQSPKVSEKVVLKNVRLMIKNEDICTDTKKEV